MSERAAMKRRVRGLLSRKWPGALGAIALSKLPVALTLGAVALLILPLWGNSPTLYAQIKGHFADSGEIMLALMLLAVDFHLDFTHLLSILPGLAILAAVIIFAGMPLSVSASGYFLKFLRGKGPKPREVFQCFSAQYPRALGSMLYMLLWVFLWALLAFAAPVGLYSLGMFLSAHFAEQLSLQGQIWVIGGAIAFCLIWCITFTLLLINRLLAYCLTPICIAAQPGMPGRMGVRLSRKLMRGCKFRLVGLYLSFLGYELPAILAGISLLLLRLLGPVFGLSDILSHSLRLCCYGIILINQGLLLYLAPYMAACLRAFFIERKREALMDGEITPADLAPRQKGDAQKPYEQEALHDGKDTL